MYECVNEEQFSADLNLALGECGCCVWMEFLMFASTNVISSSLVLQRGLEMCHHSADPTTSQHPVMPPLSDV